MTEITLEFIARQIERVLRDNADARDRLMIVDAKLSQIEISLDSLQRQIGRMNDRIRVLEV